MNKFKKKVLEIIDKIILAIRYYVAPTKMQKFQQKMLNFKRSVSREDSIAKILVFCGLISGLVIYEVADSAISPGGRNRIENLGDMLRQAQIEAQRAREEDNRLRQEQEQRRAQRAAENRANLNGQAQPPAGANAAPRQATQQQASQENRVTGRFENIAQDIREQFNNRAHVVTILAVSRLLGISPDRLRQKGVFEKALNNIDKNERFSSLEFDPAPSKPTKPAVLALFEAAKILGTPVSVVRRALSGLEKKHAALAVARAIRRRGMLK